MKTKFVYILTSTAKDYYYEQNLVSSYSLRLHNPNANVVLVVDDKTNENLVGERAELKKYVSEVVVIEAPKDFNMMQRSRYIKTNLRNLIDGDYLFIDTDTVICESLAEIDDYTELMGAVFDSNVEYMLRDTDNICDRYINDRAKQVGWESMVGSPNYNSGVIYCKDCPETHDFYTRWHNYWWECHNKGLEIDMVAFCRANKEMNYIIKKLPDVWNCQIKRACLEYLPTAKIIHYFTAKDHICYQFAKKEIQDEVKRSGLTNHVKNLIGAPRFAFEEGSIICGAKDSDFLNNTVIHSIYLYYPKMFRIMDSFARWYINSRVFLAKIIFRKK